MTALACGNDSQTDTASKHDTSGHHKHDMQVLVMFIVCQPTKPKRSQGQLLYILMYPVTWPLPRQQSSQISNS